MVTHTHIHTHTHTHIYIDIYMFDLIKPAHQKLFLGHIYIYINWLQGNPSYHLCRGWSKGSLFNSYYTEVWRRVQLHSLECSTLSLIFTMLSVKQGGIKYHFLSFSMTRPEIEPWSPRLLVNTLLIRPIEGEIYWEDDGSTCIFNDIYIIVIKISCYLFL